MRKIILATAFLLFAVFTARAADIFFATTSAGSNNGTSCANAFAYTDATNGINGAQTASWVAGNTIHLCGTITGASGATAVKVNGSGSSGNVITVKFETGAVLTAPNWGSGIDGAIEVASQSWITIDLGTNGIIQNTANGTGLAHQVDTHGIQLTNTNHITLQGGGLSGGIANLYQMTSTSDESGAGSGIFINTASNTLIQQLNIHDVSTAISYVWGNGDVNIDIENNTTSRVNWTLGSGGTGTVTGYKINGNDASCVVGATCNWTEALNNNHHNCWIIFPQNGDTVIGLVISNNFCHDINTSTGGIFLDPQSTGDLPNAKLFNDIFLTSAGQPGPANAWITMGQDGADPVTNPLIVNNTFVGPSGACFIASLNATMKNNVCNGTTNFGTILFSGFSGIASDFNSFSGLSGSDAMAAEPAFYATVADWVTGTGFDTNSITTSPNLTAAFAPNVGSPIILTGANLTSLSISGLNQDAPQTFGVGGACGTGCTPRLSSGGWTMGARNLLGGVVTPTVPTSIMPSTLTAGTVGTAYPAVAFSCVGGKAPCSFTITGAPPGVPLLLAGNPTTAGTYSPKVVATDANGKSVAQVYSIVISAAAPPPTSSFTMSTAPSSLSFSGQVGSSIACQPLTIDDNAAGPLPISVSSGAAWLTVTPGSGSTKLSSSACVSTTGLSSGTMKGGITVRETAPNSSGQTVNNSPLVVPVTLTLTAPVSTVTAVTVACIPSTITIGSTATCAAVVSGANSPSQSVSWSNGPTLVGKSAGSVVVTATSVQDATKNGSAIVTVSPASPFPVSYKCTTSSVVTIMIDALGAETQTMPTVTTNCVRQ